jgi:hypothetical protein
VAVVAAAPAATPHREMAVVMAVPMTVLMPVFVSRAVEKPSGKHLGLLVVD